MITKLQSALKLTCMIFTIIILFMLLNSTELNRKLILQVLIMSFCFAMVRYLCFDYETFTASVGRQLVFAAIVIAMTIAFSFVFAWQLSPLNLILNSALVVPTYSIIRLINYRRVVKEADEFNQKLIQRRSH